MKRLIRISSELSWLKVVNTASSGDSGESGERSPRVLVRILELSFVDSQRLDPMVES